MGNKHYYPSINLLRGIAALLVCIVHFTGHADLNGRLFEESSWTFQLGQYGVNGVYVFFVITGFVIPLSLSKSKFVLRKLPRFLAKRWVRIEIPYIASMIAVLFVGFLFSLKNNEAFTIEIARVFHHIIYTIPFTEYEWYNTIYWTLAIEFQYYILIALIFPFLVAKNVRVRLATIVLFGASSIIFKDTNLVFHFAPVFLMGMVLFLWKTEQMSLELFAVFNLLLFALTTWVNGLDIAIAGVLTTFVIGFVEINKAIFNRFGDISYSLYLTHGLVGGNLLYLLNRYTKTYSTSFFLMLGVLVLSLVVSFFFWKWIEKPSKDISKKIGA